MEVNAYSPLNVVSINYVIELYFNIRNLPRKRARQSLREMLENMSVPKYSTLRRDLFRIFKPYRWKNESEKMASFISIMSYILKESI
mmetsp:Transcript_22472/g.36122  ORF Transcript_22472/g.36122 Transcript_22472/m.36122 type:complete len:87 (+) Transcript_22472:327-587(+)|eukprot:jgi/Bigna1/63801/fgenesh1_kg.60_\